MFQFSFSFIYSVLFPGELVHILKSHTHFMKDLEERLQNWKMQGIVGDIFTKLSGSYHVSKKLRVSKYAFNITLALFFHHTMRSLREAREREWINFCYTVAVLVI